jgi:hypothetical protein
LLANFCLSPICMRNLGDLPLSTYFLNQSGCFLGVPIVGMC